MSAEVAGEEALGRGSLDHDSRTLLIRLDLFLELQRVGDKAKLLLFCAGRNADCAEAEDPADDALCHAHSVNLVVKQLQRITPYQPSFEDDALSGYSTFERPAL